MPRDLVHAVRALRATPLFTTVTVLTLALGVGTTTAMFSLVNGVLLTPLPYRDPSRLAFVETTVAEIRDRYPVLPVNAKAFLAWREHCRSTCDQLGAVGVLYGTLTGEGEPEGLVGARVSANLFSILGVRPHAGRTLAAADELPGRGDVVVLAHALWQRRFGGDPGVVGRRIVLDGEAREVVGVVPQDTHLPRFEHLFAIRGHAGEPEYFTPLTFTADERASAGDFDYAVILRLRGGSTPDQARAELSAITAEAFRGEPIHVEPLVEPLSAQIAGSARRPLWMLLGVVLAALLVACVNVANLLTGRWLARGRELAIRTAVGAGLRELLRHVVVETAVLTALGGALGVATAHAAVAALVAGAPIEIPRLDAVRVDARVLAFGAALTVACGLVCAILPAVRTWRTDASDVLRSSAHTTPGGRWSSVRGALVGTEVALTTALLVLAGLLLASFGRVLRVDPGFAVERRLAVDLKLPESRYRSAEERIRFVERLLPQVGSGSSVDAVGVAQKLPLEGEATVDSFVPDDQARTFGQQPVGNHFFVSPGYFHAMGIALVRGRPIAESDRGRRVALVSETTARTLWPGQDALGKRLSRGRRERWEIVGVVADTRVLALERPAGLVAYVPYWERTSSDLSLVVRTRADVQTVTTELRRAFHAVDAALPLLNVRTVAAVVDRATAGRRFQMWLTAGFAGASLLVACLGIYGVVAAAVHRRRPELAIRLALGETPRGILLLVARNGLGPVLWGVGCGMLAALMLGRAIQALLFDVSPAEPAVLGTVAVVVLAVATAACLEPARRAARTPPLAALRES